MSVKPSAWIWFSGRWVAWEQATVHVTAHALHYGSSVYEGLRAYATTDGPAIFRLEPHVERFLSSCRIARMGPPPFAADELASVCREIVTRNGHRDCYIRPLAFRNAAALGLNGTSCPIDVVILSFEWGRYLGADAIDHGVDAMVSSWRRFSSSSLAPLAKIGGQYVNNQFVSMEAARNGFAEGIMLDAAGNVAEGGGENLFLVFGKTLITPSIASSILAGITRDSVLTLARDLGLEVRQETISRDMLYLCDELFMTGTAAEITPVRSVDHLPIGDGEPGPITRRLQQAFFAIVSGKASDRHAWLTHVTPAEATAQDTREEAVAATTTP